MIHFTMMRIMPKGMKKRMGLDFPVGRFQISIHVIVDKLQDEALIFAGFGEGHLFIHGGDESTSQPKVKDRAALKAELTATLVSKIGEVSTFNIACFGTPEVSATPENIAKAIQWCLQNQQPKN